MLRFIPLAVPGKCNFPFCRLSFPVAQRYAVAPRLCPASGDSERCPFSFCHCFLGFVFLGKTHLMSSLACNSAVFEARRGEVGLEAPCVIWLHTGERPCQSCSLWPKTCGHCDLRFVTSCPELSCSPARCSRVSFCRTCAEQQFPDALAALQTLALSSCW